MRALIAIVFVVGLGVFAYFLGSGEWHSDASADPQSKVEVADNHEAAVDKLDKLVERSLDHALEAEDLAGDLEKAIIAARETADNVSVLRTENNAAESSAYAALVATDDAEQAARMLRAYSSQMSNQLQSTATLTNEAEEISEVVEKVERTRAEMHEAAEKAVEAEAELEDAEEDLEEVSDDATRRTHGPNTG